MAAKKPRLIERSRGFLIRLVKITRVMRGSYNDEIKIRPINL